MTKKDIFRDEILLKAKNHLDVTQLSILESILNEALYSVDLVDVSPTVPAAIDNTNSYILSLYELKRGLSLSPETMKCYMITAKDFIHYVDKPLTQITTDDVEYFFSMKKKEGCKNSTLNNLKRNLNSLFNWMEKNNFINENPTEKIPSFKEVLKPVDHMTALEFDLLKTGCKTKRDRAMIEMFRCTAMRKGEFPSVRINQIDWKTGKILIYGEKGSAYRTVMLDDIALKYLSDYIKEERNLPFDSSEPLFTNSRGDRSKPLSKHGIYMAIKRLAEKSDLDKNVYPHLFRKTTGSNIIQRGGTSDDVSAYLGHKPQGVAKRHYIHMSEQYSEKIFSNYVRSI